MRHSDVFASVEAMEPRVHSAVEAAVHKHLRATFPPQEFAAWYSNVRLIGRVDGNYVFVVPRIIVRDRVQQEAAHHIDAVLIETIGEDARAMIVSASDLPESARALVQQGVNVVPFPGEQGAEPEAPAALSFESYCVGPSNKAAYTMARAVAANTASAFPLILLHGAPGVGKTHLLTAISAEASAQTPSRRVRYMMAPIFIQEFQDALAKKRDMSAFKSLVRENDLFLLDDVHRIAGKRVTEEEFLDTISVVMAHGGQVVVSADHGPNGLDGFDERLKTQLRGATDCAIGEPDFELRRRIAASRVSAYAAMHAGFAVDPAVVDMVAARVTASGRDLDGAIKQLLMLWLDEPQTICLATAEAALRHRFVPEKKVTVDHIIKSVAKFHQLTPQELLARTRRAEIARPRQIAMYLATKMTVRSLPDIARRFGGFDHTTVLYARNSVGKKLEADPRMAAEVAAIEQAIRDGL
jgi:chromosomal replication initiator protein